MQNEPNNIWIKQAKPKNCNSEVYLEHIFFNRKATEDHAWLDQ